MDLIQKFYSDIEKIKKHNRDGSGKLDAANVKNQIASLFENNNRGMCELPHSLCDYWITEYVQPELDSGSSEISAAVIDKLAAMYAFLIEEPDTDALNDSDWKVIGEAVNYEAEDLPIEALTSLMKTLVEKQAY